MSLCVGCACLTLAQTASILQAPPPIQFEAWRETERREFYRRYELSFPSPYHTPYPRNDIVKLTITMPTDTAGPVPVVVLLHYWGASRTSVEDALSRNLAERGVASVLMPLPYHLSRTPPNTLSGELAVQADPEVLRKTMTQSVQDVRRTIDWIATRSEFDSTKIGVNGTSLGAMVAALAFAVDSRIAASCYVLGGADLAHILWNSSRVVSQREGLRKLGYTEAKMREELKDIEPLNYLDPSDMRPSFVIAARYDTVIPPVDSEKLIAALGNSQELWLNTGHYGGVLVGPKISRTVARYFQTTFSGQKFEAPTVFYSPTLRFGLHADDESGVQVIAGLDVWRLRAAGKTFASLLVTPRGVLGYIGHTVSRELSIGITITRKRTTWGVLWSVVL